MAIVFRFALLFLNFYGVYSVVFLSSRVLVLGGGEERALTTC